LVVFLQNKKYALVASAKKVITEKVYPAYAELAEKAKMVLSVINTLPDIIIHRVLKDIRLIAVTSNQYSDNLTKSVNFPDSLSPHSSHLQKHNKHGPVNLMAILSLFCCVFFS
jgi:hypothetical protein